MESGSGLSAQSATVLNRQRCLFRQPTNSALACSTGSGLAPYQLGEPAHPNHLQPVKSAGDQFSLIMRFELKSNPVAFDLDHARETVDPMAQRCRRQMAD